MEFKCQGSSSKSQASRRLKTQVTRRKAQGGFELRAQVGGARNEKCRSGNVVGRGLRLGAHGYRLKRGFKGGNMISNDAIGWIGGVGTGVGQMEIFWRSTGVRDPGRAIIGVLDGQGFARADNGKGRSDQGGGERGCWNFSFHRQALKGWFGYICSPFFASYAKAAERQKKTARCQPSSSSSAKAAKARPTRASR